MINLSRLLIFFLTLVLILMPLTGIFGQTLKTLRADGKIIETTDNEEVILRGVNLGQWLIMEGFMSGSNGNMSQGDMKRKLFDSGISESDIENYFQQWRDNFISKDDIDFIASKGFNCVRIPLHYELFLTNDQRVSRNAVIYTDGANKETNFNNYKTSLQNWVNNNELAVDDDIDGFKVIDNVVEWCKANHIYVILDMHAVPGSVGDKRNITDEIFIAKDFFYDAKNRATLIEIWEKISERYKDEPTVCAYDLINEPHKLNDAQIGILRDIYEEIISNIRSINDNKLIIIQGDEFGNQYQENTGSNSLFPNDFSNNSNLVYSIHRYRFPNNTWESNPWGLQNHVGYFADAVDFQDTYNVPMFVGETGLDDDYNRLAGNFDLMDDLKYGSTLWTHKHHQDGNDLKCFADIIGSSPWDNLSQWSNGTLFENIKWENCVVNPNEAFWEAVSPKYSIAPNVKYKIINYNSGKYMEVVLPSTNDGDNVNQWEYIGEGNQHWTFVYNDGWTVTNVESMKVLEIENGSTSNGGNAQQWENTNSDAQKWWIEWIDGHANKMENKSSNKYLEVNNMSTVNGANIQQWGTSFTDGRKWIIVPVWIADETTSSTVELNKPKIKVYPNPSSDAITIEINDDTIYNKIELFSISGIKVFEKSMLGNRIIVVDTSNLVKGSYFLKITGEKTIYSKIILE